jgi:hypothetical protein
VEFESEDYPSEKLIACQNPLIAEKNQKQTEALFFTALRDLVWFDMGA